MKKIHVAAAIITDDINNPTKIYATERGYGEFKGGWEFPGGKLEVGESAEDAIVREIFEELDTKISVGKHITTIEYDYPNFHLTMDCFLATIISGDLNLKEASAAKWLTKDELLSVNWLPADLSLIEILKIIL